MLRSFVRPYLKVTLVGLISLAAWGLARAEDEQALPNIVIVFTDDQGYADVGVFGAQGFTTPHLDRLAAAGRRFTNFYVAQPVCSASRAALLTGCYPNRIGIHGALGPHNEIGIHDDELTLAELCRSRGYATGIFGKWHLGHHPQFLPLAHGFEEFAGIPYSNDMWPLHPSLVDLPPGSPRRQRGYPPLPFLVDRDIANSEVSPDDQAQFTTELTRRAVDFIDRHHAHPFFLYVPHPMPHVPVFVSDKFAGRSQQGRYGDVIMELDWSVGQIVAALERHQLTDNTLVVFTSDNGPWTSYGNHAGSVGPLREAKGTTFEGGVRVPCIMRWPRRIPAGTVCDEPLMTIDLLPTIAGLIGAALPDHPIDGLDVWPLLAGTPGAKSPHEAYFFYYHAGDLEAVRSGRWKLHFPHSYRTLGERPGGVDGRPTTYDQAAIGLALYDLDADPGESIDLADRYPEVLERLSQLADRMRADLGDRLTNVVGQGLREPGRVANAP